MSRIRLIDFMHLAQQARAVDIHLQTTVLMDGLPTTIDTKIMKLTTKQVYLQSGKGSYYVGVFLEGRNTKRKKYFRELNERRGINKDYKGSREHSSSFYEDVNRTVSTLFHGGVSCFKYEKIDEFGKPYDGVEADDLIVSMVHQLKEAGVTMPIDIVTNDSDLLPLVDDQVSVYLRGTRTYAESGSPEFTKYYQFTPRSWDEAIQYRSQFAGYYIPYNSMLLYKLIRGDSADEYEGIGKLAPEGKSLGKVGYSKLMQEMVDDGVDFANTFRYGKDFDKDFRPVLEKYFSEDAINHMYDTYLGIDMENVKLSSVNKLDIGELQKQLTPFNINLMT